MTFNRYSIGEATMEMKVTTKIMLAGGIGWLVLTAMGDATAQEQSADANNAATVKAEESLPTDPQERIAWADRQNRELDILRKRIQRMLDSARAEHDIIKVTCLNDKLTQTNTNMASFADRLNSFKRAVSLNDQTQQDHEFTLLAVLVQKGQTLAAEASSCVGEEAGYTGKTDISTEIDDDITRGDPTQEDIPGVDPSVDVRPPDASGNS